MVSLRPRRLSLCALGASWMLAAACDAFDGTPEAPAVVVEAGVVEAGVVEAGLPPGDAGVEAGAPGCSAAAGCTVLFAGEDEPTELVRRGSLLYWLRGGANGAFVRGLVDGGASSDGGAPNGEVDPGAPLDGLRGLRYASANAGNPLAISKDGLLYRAFPRSSCPGPGPFSLADGFGGGIPLVATAGSTVQAGTCGAWSALVPDAGATVSALRSEGQTIWWATQNGDVRTCTYPCSTGDAGAPRLIVEEKGPVLGLAVDADRVYWIIGGRISFLRKAAAPDEKPTTLATGQGTIRALAVGSSTVYWTTDQGLLLSASVNPLTVPTVLLEGLDQPWGLELDPDAVYVAERGNGRILRVARR